MTYSGMGRISRGSAAALFAMAFAFAMPAARAATGDSAKIARLALEVTRAEDIRAVRRVQISFAHYSSAGLWTQMGALFAADGVATYGNDTIKGPAAIAAYYRANWGNGREGLPAGTLHTALEDTEVLNLSEDGKTAKARWQEMLLSGSYGGSASFQTGIMENDYVKVNGVWKIAGLHYTALAAGPYEEGWKRVGQYVADVPFHYTADTAGLPVPPIPADMEIPATGESLASLNKRLQAMNDADKVTNLQSAYNFYTARKMWDDAADLFTDDAVLEDPDGIWVGAKSIRHSYQRMGGPELKRGELNNHIAYSILVTVAPNGTEAVSRALAFNFLGDYNSGKAYLGVDVLQNRYVRGADGIWRIREMRTFPLMATDYYQGWHKSRIVPTPPTGEFAPDRAVPAADRATLVDGAVPVFLDNNPVTGKPVTLPAGVRAAGATRLLPAPKAIDHPISIPNDIDAAIADGERKVLVENAYMAANNLGHALGHNIDDQSWHRLGLLFAKDGWRAKAAVAFCVGPAHAEMCETDYDGVAARPRLSASSHWLVQPVINVRDDGKYATMRNYLIHFNTTADYGSGLTDGVYPNNAVKLENGTFKFDVAAPDQPYLSAPSWKAGWMRTEPRMLRGAPTKQAIVPLRMFPADIPRTSMPLRHHGSVPGDMILWPDIKPMWFSYKNPVSGRMPANYCPDLKTCEKDLLAAQQAKTVAMQKMLPPNIESPAQMATTTQSASN